MDEADKGAIDLNALGPGDLFFHFCEKSIDVAPILEAFHILLDKLQLGSFHGLQLYEELKKKLTTWKAKSLWELLDKKLTQKEYCQQNACKGMRVLIVGAGPVGMRLAIECALLGCEAVIVEKRHYFSRNNVLHLWPFTIDDLKRLGAKKFYGQFCAGAIDHISIRTLQSMMLKICLLFGIQIHFDVEFKAICEPTNSMGWHAELSPGDHKLNSMEFDALVGAEGRSSRIPGFDRKELRAKLALAITANFVNYHSTEEAAVQEISGVAFIFNQKFFKELKADTGIDLENLVYYKDDTHYFIMTAKKESLLQKGVLKKDFADPYDLLAPSNRNIQAMYDYSLEAADWSTELPRLEFALNHKNIPDVDLFDFTSVYQAEYAARAVRRKGKDLLICLVGDSLVNPFWPQGTGCARGFLSAMDAAWMIRGFGQGKDVLGLLAERECLYQKLTQTKPENLMKNFAGYTINPHSRYPNLHFNVGPNSVWRLYDSDDAATLPKAMTGKRVVPPSTSEEVAHVPEKKIKQEKAPPPQVEVEKSPPTDDVPTSPLRSVNQEGQITRALYGTPEEKANLVSMSVLMKWFKEELKDYKVTITTLEKSFQNGLVLCSLIHRYFPELIPEYSSLTERDKMKNNQLAFSLLYEHLNLPQLLKASEMLRPDRLALFTYLSSVYEAFQVLEPAEVPMEVENEAPKALKASPAKRKLTRRSSQFKSVLVESWNTRTPRKSLSPEKHLSSSKKVKRAIDFEEETQEEEPKKKKPPPTSLPTPSAAATDKDKANSTSTPSSKPNAASTPTPTPTAAKRPGVARSTPRPISTFGSPTTTSDMCFFCGKRVYLMERMSANGVFFHRPCFRCSHCNTQLNLGHYSMSKGQNGEPGKFFCPPHYRQLFLSNPQAINYGRVSAASPSPIEKEPPKLDEKIEPVPPDSSQTPSKATTSAEKPEIVVGGDDESERQLTRTASLASRVRSFWRSRKSRRTPSPKPETLSPSPEVISPPPELLTPPPEFRGTPESDQTTEETPSFHSTTDKTPLKRTPEPTTSESSKEKDEKTPEPVSIKPAMERSREQTPESVPEEPTEMGRPERTPSPPLSSFSTPSGDSSPSSHKLRSNTMRPARPAPPPPYHRTHRSLSSLATIPEQNKASPETFRARSPPVMTGRPGTTPSPGVRPSPTSTSSRRRRARGQRLLARPMKTDGSDLDRQKQQERFLEAQAIQREMSQIELQYDEMEEIGREVEQNLRDAEGTAQEDRFMKTWLHLISERNSLVRRTAELNLQKKNLELEDKQFELEKEMREMSMDEDASNNSKYEEMLDSLVKVIEERNDIVQQVEQERQMEIEEDESRDSMFATYFGEDQASSSNSRGSTKSKGGKKFWRMLSTGGGELN